MGAWPACWWETSSISRRVASSADWSFCLILGAEVEGVLGGVEGGE